MSNYKKIVLFALIAVCLYNCKPGSQYFCYDYTVKKEFFTEAMTANDLEGVNIDSIQVFRATLIERLVERDAVPEYKLVNTQSHEPYAELADSKNYHYLYLFRLYPEGNKERVIVYMATSFAANNICIGVGPVYTGVLDQSDKQAKIQFKSILQITKAKKQDDPDFKKMKAAAKKAKKEKKRAAKKKGGTDDEEVLVQPCAPESVKRKYELTFKKDNHLIFLPGTTFTQVKDSLTIVRIGQIIRKEVNKIGGEKALIFTTDRVFGDSNALVFTYFSTIK